MAGFSKDGITLLGMGNPLLDISAEVPEALLEEYGVSLNNAILAEEKHLPLYRKLVEEYKVEYIAGGATQNSIRVAQWMSPAGSTGYLGAVGKDDFGRQLEECAAADGVQVNYMHDDATPTGTCAVLVHGGERSLVANLAAANNFKPDHLETPAAKAMIESAQFYYVAGFFLTVSVDALLSVATHAAARGKVFALNLSAPFLVDFFGDALAAALPYADYLFGNESEAAAYGAKHGLGSDVATIALAIAAGPKASGTRARTVVITQGCDSTLVAQNGTVQSFAVPPLDKAALVDTNGAGDAFVGGFLAQLMRGAPLARCVEAGHWAARQIIQRSGCTFPPACDFE
ncbi:flagellar associated protein, partial [Tribonema minus]